VRVDSMGMADVIVTSVRTGSDGTNRPSPALGHSQTISPVS